MNTKEFLSQLQRMNQSNKVKQEETQARQANKIPLEHTIS